MSIYENINLEDYKSRFHDDGTAHLLLDVRTEKEFNQARIPGAINIPLEELVARINEVEDNAEEMPIVVVCRTGVRSIMGAQLLYANGLNSAKLYNLENGTLGWAQQRWPLETGAVEEA